MGDECESQLPSTVLLFIPSYPIVVIILLLIKIMFGF